MILEQLDRRILAAIRFRDGVAGLPIAEPLAVAGNAGVRLLRNTCGLYVLIAAPSFERYRDWFQPPPSVPVVAPTTLELTVHDPSGTYLPRRFAVKLPRRIDPANADATDSIFRPIDIDLLPAPSAHTAAGWAVIRATVVEAGTDPPRGLAFALLRVRGPRNGAESVLGRGMADARGEALVAVPDIPATNWSAAEDGPVVNASIAATLDALWVADAGAAPDPDALDALWATVPTASTAVQLAAGREIVVGIELALPP